MLTDDRLRAIARTVPTPFYCYDAEDVRGRFDGLKRHLPDGADIYYSLKANPNKAIVSTLCRIGAGCEVSSVAELDLALAAGADRRRVIFVGPAKSPADLARGIEAGIKAIVAESCAELLAIQQVAAARGVVQPVALRINPDFKSTRVRIAMTGRASQFGIDEADLGTALDTAEGCPNLLLVGLHVYLGSRILDEEAVAANTANILDLAREVRRRLGRQLAFVDVGGGFGVRYFDKERDLDGDLLGSRLAALIAAFRAEAPRTRVIIELGRFLVARAGVFVTAVRYVKTSKGRHFAVCDGGSNCHAAAAGHGSAFRRNFPIRRLGPAPAEQAAYTLTGPLCTPSDVIGDEVELPVLAPGDLICVERSGAYGPSASPVHFLSFGHPAEVMVDGPVTALVRRADPPDHLSRQQTWIELDTPWAPPAAAREAEHAL